MGNAGQPEERRSLLPVVVLVLLPAVYLASLGPLVGLYERGMIPDPVDEVLAVMYWPMNWLLINTDFFDEPPGSAYMWYVQLFEP